MRLLGSEGRADVITERREPVFRTTLREGGSMEAGEEESRTWKGAAVDPGSTGGRDVEGQKVVQLKRLRT